MTDRHILISGAGIAGNATAYWLRRHGLIPTAVERAPAPREGGYKIDVRGAALDVVGRMGVTAEVRRARTDMRGTSFVNGAGTQVASIDSDVVGGRAGEDVEIMRGDLNRILYNQVESDVEYLFDDSVTSITENEGRVRVTFEHGRARTFDAVVGADGLHSHTRAVTFGADSQFVRDLGYYVSIFDLPNHLDLDRRELIYPLPGKTALLYSTAGSTDAKAMFFFASPPLDYDRRDLAQQHTLLADAFAGVGWEVPRTLASMAEASDFYFDSLSQIRMQQWWRGRTVMVGAA